MISSRSDRRLLRTVVLITALAISVAACGSSDSTPIDAGEPSGDETSENQTGDPQDGDSQQSDPEEGDSQNDSSQDSNSQDRTVPDLSEGYQRVEAMVDILDPQVANIDDIIVDADGLTLIVRYVASAEPCAGAIVEVTEAETSIAVTLKTGLHPNAAAMSCIAGVFGYEQAVTLDAPVAGRDIIMVGSASEGTADGDAGGGADDAGSGALTSPDGFVGLPLTEAQLLADQEGRPWRIGRQDDETFALTEDYNEQRVTFEVDEGVVTAAVAG